MSTANQQNLEVKNKLYSANFNQGSLALAPAERYAVVTCMDARIDPVSAFGITLGDAHVIRNAGGSARDAYRSLVISQQLLGTTEIILVKHTGCGMLTFSNEDARGLVGKNLGPAAGHEVEELDFLPFGDLVQEVKKDVEWLKAQATVAKEVVVSGWVYEVETGQTRKIV